MLKFVHGFLVYLANECTFLYLIKLRSTVVHFSRFKPKEMFAKFLNSRNIVSLNGNLEN